MDTRITLPESATRRTSELVVLILNDMSLETGMKIVLGRTLPSALDESFAPEGSVAIPARDILEAALERSGRHRLWLLLWDPTLHDYVFSMF
jgi:hypothetical protein